MPKNKTGNLERAKRKIQHYGGREYGGCFTPSEILSLVENGVHVAEYWKKRVEHVKELKKKGDSEPMWFYFELGKLDYVVKKNDHDTAKTKRKS